MYSRCDSRGGPTWILRASLRLPQLCVSNAAYALLQRFAPFITHPRLLTGNEHQEAVQQLSFDFQDVCSSRRQLLRAAWTLRRQGVIMLRKAAAQDLLAALNARLENVLKQLELGETSELNSRALLNLPDKRQIKGYENFVNADQSVINVRIKRPDGRSGSDAGMVDIFHPERLSNAWEQLVLDGLNERLVRRLLLAASWRPMRVKCRNLYVNRGVQDTRGFHCDGRSHKFKSFLFLTPVRALTDGPYCYVPTTHRDRRTWSQNRRFNAEHGCNRHEYSQLQGLTALPLLAEPGDLVISSQRGAHRGLPQHPDAQRSVLVNMFQR